MPILKHLASTNHKRALLPHIDKLLAERVLLGTSVGSQEIYRYVGNFNS